MATNFIELKQYAKKRWPKFFQNNFVVWQWETENNHFELFLPNVVLLSYWKIMTWCNMSHVVVNLSLFLPSFKTWYIHTHIYIYIHNSDIRLYQEISYLKRWWHFEVCKYALLVTEICFSLFWGFWTEHCPAIPEIFNGMYRILHICREHQLLLTRSKAEHILR